MEKQGAVIVMKPHGAITASQCADMVDDVMKSLGPGKPMLVIELHGVPLIDSAGLEMLLDLRDRIESRGGGVKLAAASPLCGEILRVTGVGQRFEQYPMLKTAVGSFAE